MNAFTTTPRLSTVTTYDRFVGPLGELNYEPTFFEFRLTVEPPFGFVATIYRATCVRTGIEGWSVEDNHDSPTDAKLAAVKALSDELRDESIRQHLGTILDQTV